MPMMSFHTFFVYIDIGSHWIGREYMELGSLGVVQGRL